MNATVAPTGRMFIIAPLLLVVVLGEFVIVGLSGDVMVVVLLGSVDGRDKAPDVTELFPADKVELSPRAAVEGVAVGEVAFTTKLVGEAIGPEEEVAAATMEEDAAGAAEFGEFGLGVGLEFGAGVGD